MGACVWMWCGVCVYVWVCMCARACVYYVCVRVCVCVKSDCSKSVLVVNIHQVKLVLSSVGKLLHNHHTSLVPWPFQAFRRLQYVR